MELNREQIIKALECCPEQEYCGDCPYDNECMGMEFLILDALSLIKELTEENERLRAEVSVKKKLLYKCVDLEDRVKADTVRKMQERLKAKANENETFPYGGYIHFDDIDPIAKEMLTEIDK